ASVKSDSADAGPGEYLVKVLVKEVIPRSMSSPM
ncbi:MAG: hypothetical protein QOH48_1081, partial [Actinomycetota bacterium]|nr:hypothetical protein [Actinomycetota bacterium]